MKAGRTLLVVLGVALLQGVVVASCSAQAVVPGGKGFGDNVTGESAVESAPKFSPLAQFERRLLVNEEKLALWRELAGQTTASGGAAHRPAEWPGCYAALEGLVSNYQRQLQKVDNNHGVAPESWQVLAEDIAFLEGGCPQVYRQVANPAGSGAAEPAAGAEAATVADAAPGSPGPPPAAVKPPQLDEAESLATWNKAVGLLDAGKYDDAIPVLSGLLDTSYGVVAKEKILEAQTAIATQLRRQAAGVFVKARKTEVLAQKTQLLEESWTLLNKIVTQYPEIGIIDKVRQNLAQIEDLLEKLDPAVLQRLKHPAGDKG